MAAKANYYKLGLFVIIGFAIAIILVILLGASKWLQQKVMIETYFDESVQGLSIGSKVRYRGVIMGDVTRIAFTAAKYPEARNNRYVLVEAAMNPDAVAQSFGQFSTANTAAEIKKGLRIRLASQGITGLSYLEIDYADPQSSRQLPIAWQPDYFYIPSAPSTTAQFLKSVEYVFDRLQKLDLEGTINNWNALVTSSTKKINALDTQSLSQIIQKINKAPLDKLGKDTSDMVAQLKQASATLNTLLQDPATQAFPENANAAVQKMRELLESPAFAQSLRSLQRSLQRLDRITAGSESDISNTLSNLEQITNNLRELSDNAKRYPSSVFFGDPPKKETP